MSQLRLYLVLIFYLLICIDIQGQQDYILTKQPLWYEVPALKHIKEINDVLKDKNGFVWIASFEGLYRYDGFETKQYSYNPNYPQKIAGNWIGSLTEDADGNIWFSVFGVGLQKLNPKSETFTLYKANQQFDGRINNIILRKGKIWLNTQNGTGIFNEQKNTFKKYNNLGGYGHLFKDANDRLWHFSYQQQGIFEYDDTQDSFILRSNTQNKFCLPMVAYQDNIFCTVDGKFSVYNTTNHSLKQIENKIKGDIICASLTPDNKILIASQYAFDEYNPANSSFVTLLYDIRLKEYYTQGLSSTIEHLNPKSILLGANKAIIFNYKPTGIDKYEFLDKKGKHEFMPNQLHNLPDCKLGLGQYAILDLDKVQVNYPYSKYTALKKFANADNLNKSYTMRFVDKSNDSWISHTILKNDITTLYKFNWKGQLDLIGEVPNYGGFAGILKEDNILWIGAWNNLIQFNIQTKKTNFIKESKDSTGLSALGLRTIFLDSEGDLWVGTSNGLNRRKKGESHFMHYRAKEGDKNSLSANTIINIHEDKEGLIWVGTFGGLNVFDKQTNRFKWYTTQDGLADNIILSIELQADKTIWMSHTKGISQLNSRSGKVLNFNASDGVAEGGTIDNASATLSDGSIVFAVYGALTRIYPDKLKPDSTKVPFYITDIKLFNNSLEINGKDSILHQSINFTNSLTFKHDENVISFQYAALDYTESEHRQYAYVLEGFDKNWQYVGQKREVTFTNLPPGTYRFRVKSSNRYGLWQEMDHPLSITILPPWWQTWWAYLLYTFAFIFAIRRYILYRSRHLEQENIALEAKVNKRTIELKNSLETLKFTQAQLIQKEKLASLGELTAGIAHEIQNPLNFVNNFSELSVELIEEIKSPLTPDGGIREGEKVDMELLEDVVVNLEKINLHGKRASSIVKGMLEHSRTVIGEPELTDINQLADEYLRLAYHGFRAKDKGFNAEYELITDKSLPKINVVPQEIGRVLLNLLNNAFYAVQEQGKRKTQQEDAEFKPLVTLSTKAEKGQIIISVKDNGAGIPENIKAKIFQPFFTTKPTGEGTGLGLSLAYDIVTKGHGGTIEVESVESQGTTFIVTLPL